MALQQREELWVWSFTYRQFFYLRDKLDSLFLQELLSGCFVVFCEETYFTLDGRVEGVRYAAAWEGRER